MFVEVAVDPDLGETRVRRIVGPYGAGRVINPKPPAGPCIGGMIGGIGMALMETPSSTRATAACRTRTSPITQFPCTLTHRRDGGDLVPEEDPHLNPLGVKGLGEIALVGVAPAISMRPITPPASASANCLRRRDKLL